MKVKVLKVPTTKQTGGNSPSVPDIVQQVIQKLQSGENQDQVFSELVSSGVPQQEAQKIVQTAIQMVQGGNSQMKAGGKWIQKAIKHPGRCAHPGDKNCPKGSPQYNLAMRFKHGDLHKKQTGGLSDNYYKANAMLSYYKNILNQKLKAKDPKAFSNYFKGLVDLRRQGKISDADKYIQNTQYNTYLTPDEVKATLGDQGYQNYLNSLQAVNTYDVKQGMQPLYGTEEGNKDVTKLNYGRRFASLLVTPSLSVSNKEGTKRYSRDYTYNPSTGTVDWTEEGDLGLRPYYLSAPTTDTTSTNTTGTFKYGGDAGTPQTYGLPDGMSHIGNVNAEEGEVFEDGRDNILKVADDAGTHEQGGVMLPNVRRVLENTSSLRKDKASKLLKVAPEEMQTMFGFKPKKSLSHADAYEEAVGYYNKKRLDIQKKNKDINLRPEMDKYGSKSATLNFKTLNNLPKDDEVFDMLFGHQQTVKAMHHINDDGTIEKKYGGWLQKTMRRQAGGDNNTPDLGLYRGPVNRSGRNLYTPTGKTSEAKLSDQEIVDRYKQAGIDLGNLRGKALQSAIYTYLIDNQPDVLRQVLKEYGPNIQSEKMGFGKAKAFTDPLNATKADLKAVLPGLLDAMPGARIPLPDVSESTQYPKTVPQPSFSAAPQIPDTSVNVNPQFINQPANKFHEPTYWEDLAPGLMSLSDSMVRDPELYNRADIHQLRYKLMDPTAALFANQADYNAAAKSLTDMPLGSGVNASNLANLTAQKYKMNANILGDYENRNAAIKNSEINYNTQAKDRQSAADYQTRGSYYRNVQLSRENQRQQRLKAIEDLARVIQMKRRQNTSGNLILKLSPAFNQQGEYNGYQYVPVIPPELGYTAEQQNFPTPAPTTTRRVSWRVGNRTVPTK